MSRQEEVEGGLPSVLPP